MNGDVGLNTAGRVRVHDHHGPRALLDRPGHGPAPAPDGLSRPERLGRRRGRGRFARPARVRDRERIELEVGDRVVLDPPKVRVDVGPAPDPDEDRVRCGTVCRHPHRPEPTATEEPVGAVRPHVQPIRDESVGRRRKRLEAGRVVALGVSLRAVTPHERAASGQQRQREQRGEHSGHDQDDLSGAAAPARRCARRGHDVTPRTRRDGRRRRARGRGRPRARSCALRGNRPR